MSDRKPDPTANDNASDELFDRDFMSDSDSDFLAELDRVLSSEKKPTNDNGEASTEETPTAKDGSGFDSDLLLDDFADLAQPSAAADPSNEAMLEAATDNEIAPAEPPTNNENLPSTADDDGPDWDTLLDTDPADELPETFDELLQAQTADVLEGDSAPPSSVPQEPVKESEDLLLTPVVDNDSDSTPDTQLPLDDLADDIFEPFDASLSQQYPAAPDNEPTHSDFAPPTQDEDAFATDLASDSAPNEPFVRLSPDEPAPAHDHAADVDIELAEQDTAEQQSSDNAAQLAAVGAASALAAGALQSAAADKASPQQPTDNPPEAPTRSSSPAWNGLVALLALLGIGAGGGALWLNMQTNHQLSSLPRAAENTDSAPAPATLAISSEPSALMLERLSQTEQRITDMEQRVEQEIVRVSGELDALYEAVTARPSPQTPDNNTKPDPRLEQLTNDVSQLQTHLTALQAELSASREAFEKNQQQQDKPATPSAQANASPKPAPEEPKPIKNTLEGAYVVNLMSFRQQAKALSERERLLAEGIAVELISVSSHGKTWHRLSVDGFESFDAAKGYVERVRNHPGLSTAWIGRVPNR